MNPTQERWLPVVGYEGIYEVSDQGRVRSLDREMSWSDGRTGVRKGHIRKPALVGDRDKRRLQLSLRRDGKSVRRYVHRLVLEAFVGPCPEGMECCHYDDDPLNNRLENLRWDTSSSNKLDRIRNGLDHNSNKTHCPQGHEYTAENILWKRGGRKRACRQCDLEYKRRARSAKKAA